MRHAAPRHPRTLRRLGAFSVVAALGFVVQASVLLLLTSFAGLHLAAATAVGVQLAVLHNFVWHERWTWGDRDRAAGLFTRLLRFNLVTGGISLIGTVALTTLYASALGAPIVIGNLLAVWTVGVINYLVLDRAMYPESRPQSRVQGLRGSARALPVVLLAAAGMVVFSDPANGAGLTAETVSAWDAYVHRTETRVARELADGRRFLALDFEREPHRVRDSLLRGELVSEEVRPSEGGPAVEVPGGTIHHWRAAVLVPGVTLDGLIAALRNPRQHGYHPQDVLKWRVLERDGDRERVLLRIRRQEIVTAVFNTEHDVAFTAHGPDRISSRSIATRIAELSGSGAEAGEKPIGQDRGFLWRLNSYWRYEAVAGGVLVELESLTLSRDVPTLLGPVARPIVARVARESLERTLGGIRDQIGRSAR